MVDLDKLQEITDKLNRSKLLKGMAYDVLNTFIKQQKEQLTIPVVSNSVICCPQCGNERLESTGGGWYICGDRSCDWGDKL